MKNSRFIFGGPVAQPTFQRLGELRECRDVETLGARAAVDPLSFEKSVDLGLGPAIAADLEQNPAQVLPSLQKDLTDDFMKPCQIGDQRRVFRVSARWRRSPS